MEAKGWISGDESAKEMLGRVLSRTRPFLLLPPLHRVPLRPRNVLEIVGPSPSAKTHLLIQAALTCVLPIDWNGVHYGGFDGFDQSVKLIGSKTTVRKRDQVLLMMRNYILCA
ncbi:dna repair protein xrcc2 like protein [Quercus suber]|uniref:Dna repair protein xrcc2 like protein n=1 Tax=Quercus suber TaxID=58331 RepID=A0AAW0LTA4_QUESU